MKNSFSTNQHNMSAEDTITKLKNLGYSKQEIDSTLHKLTLIRLQQEKKQSLHSSTISAVRIKTLHSLKHITAAGLCLLKTQFAKKPKNPI